MIQTSDMRKPKVAVIIVNYNSFAETKDCLNSLNQLDQSLFYLKIILVDNASKNFPGDHFNKEFPNVITITLPENTGFTGGNNSGIEKALGLKSDYIFILNNDTILEKFSVDKLVGFMEENTEIGIAGPKIYFLKGYEYHSDRYTDKEKGKVIWYAGGKIDWPNALFSHKGIDEVDRGQYNKTEETNFISGCAMMIRSDAIKTIGNFDERYFLYLEDIDLCFRAKQAGFKLVYFPDAIIWHKNASSSDKPGSIIHQYYQTRNRLLFAATYSSTRTKFALLRESLKFYIKGGIKRKAVSDFYLRKFGRGI